MASPNNDDTPPEEDVLRDDMEDQEEEGGEDLFDTIGQDYAPRPELDAYDPNLVDDAEHDEVTIEQRRAAEEAMEARDAQERRQRRPREPTTPGRYAPSTPFSGSEIDPFSPSSAGKRRRIAATPTSAERRAEDGFSDAGFEEDDIPESYYDLSYEELNPDDVAVDKRLETKIRRCFQQFLLKFKSEGQDEPKYPDALRKMAEEHQAHLDVKFVDLEAWSAKLALWVADRPVLVLPILNETLMNEAERRYGTYRLMRQRDENQLRVAIHSFFVQDAIRELCTKHLNKLVCVVGVATKRTKVLNQVNRLHLRCAKCNYPSGPYDVKEGEELKPGSCLECQSKGPFRVDRKTTLYQNYQRLTLQESPSSVEPGKMPRSKEVIVTGDQVDTIRPGDELTLTGVYRCRYDAASNARTCFPVFKTDIEAVHVQRKGDVKLLEITDDRQQQILELAKSPGIRERIINSIAPSIYGMHHVKTAIALSMFGGQSKIAAGKHRIRGDLNVLVVGDPGLAKSQFLKYVESVFPRAVYTTGKGASAVGLTASVSRDEHGEWCLEGGAMVLADDGMCLIDEFDKMNDQDRTSIHEAMEQQTISISKAGIVATLQARCAVVAVANPIDGRYNPQQTFAQNVNLADPILSRFDLMCVLRDEADSVQDERLADHVICSHIRSHPNATPDQKLIKPKVQQRQQGLQPLDQDMLQKYICYARQKVFPKVSEMDTDKLANFYRDLRAESFRSGGAPVTARFLDSIVRLCEASARMELRNQVIGKDLDFAIATTLESFVQSQKHQVAEEIRKKFKRYLTQSQPASEQFMSVLDKIFKNVERQRRLARPGGDVPDLSDLSIEVKDVVQYMERNELELEDAHSFFRTPRFQQNFRVEGDKIYRIV